MSTPAQVLDMLALLAPAPRPAKKPRKEKPCTCPRCLPQPGQDPDPRYGYDRNAVPAIKCLLCDEPIGHEPYKEVIMLARFGSMMFRHERCKDERK